MPDIDRNGMTGQVSTNLGRVALRPRGEYTSGEIYDRLDLVRYGGDGWICKQDGTTETPENGASWMLYVEHGDSGNAILAQSWAEGGTGSRSGEDTDNAKYFSEQSNASAAAAAESEKNTGESAAAAQASKDAAEAAQEAAEQARGAAETASTTAVEKAAEAEKSAETAVQYSGKPPVVKDGHWWTWDADAQQYTDTGERSVLNYDVSYPSVAAMIADKDRQPPNTVAIISSSVEEEDNAKIYIRDDADPTGWKYLADLSGFGGGGDMEKNVYDPQGKKEDIFAYVDAAVEHVRIETDPEPREGSENPVASGGVYTAVDDIRQKIINKNSLINWYFIGGGSQQGGGHFPINRRGETKYTASGYFIDRWKIDGNIVSCTLTKSGLEIVSSGQVYLVQPFEKNFLENMLGIPITLSFLTNDGNLYSFTKVFENADSEQTYDSTVAENIALRMQTKDSLFYVMILSTRSTPIKVAAAKLELGSVQTLAHQDGDGNWVLNEIPDFAEQYIICEQYSPTTGEFVGSVHTNIDILDNSYFIGGGSQQGGGQFPVNQRSQTRYTTAAYTIDRWKAPSTGSIELEKNGIKGASTTTGGAVRLMQPIENPGRFNKKTITFSALFSEITSSCTQLLIAYTTADSPASTWKSGPGSLPVGVSSLTVSLPDNLTALEVYMTFADGRYEDLGRYSVCSAAKLELGPVQTLAHKEGDEWVLNGPPPDYALELAKCQRHFICNSNTSVIYGYGVVFTTTDCYIFIPTPCTMRAIPRVTNITNKGVLYLDNGNKQVVTTSDITVAFVNPGGICLLLKDDYSSIFQHQVTLINMVCELDANL